MTAGEPGPTAEPRTATGQSAGTRRRILLAWWGSMPGAHATIGDMLALRSVAGWAVANGLQPVIAALREGTVVSLPAVDWRQVEPADLSAFCFVCGPLLPNRVLQGMLERFASRPKLALGVSVLHLSRTDLFDGILVRDSDAETSFDLATSSINDFEKLFPRGEPPSPPPGGPLRIGLCLRGPQREYGGAEICRDDIVSAALAALESNLSARWHTIDTRPQPPSNTVPMIIGGFRQSDLVITTRMHGALLSLACGRPVVAIDQIASGRKVARLMKKIDFPFLLQVEDLTPDRLARAVESALAAQRDLWAELGRRATAEADAALEQAGRLILSSIGHG